MNDRNGTQYTDPDGTFEVTLPPAWVAEPDGEGGVLVYRKSGGGLLHLMPFDRERDVVTDPVEELYAFLAEQEIELDEEEIDEEELAGGGSIASTAYVAEEEDEAVFWLVGVATAPGRLLFASYSCAAGEEGSEVGTVRGILSTLAIDDSNRG